LVRCGAELLRHGELGRVGIHLRLRPIIPHPIRLGAHDAPCPAIVIEGTRRQREELLLLGVVQHPEEVPVIREEDQHGRGVVCLERRTHHGTGAGQVALREGELRLHLDDVEVGGCEREGAIHSHPCLGIAAQPEQGGRDTTRRVG